MIARGRGLDAEVPGGGPNRVGAQGSVPVAVPPVVEALCRHYSGLNPTGAGLRVRQVDYGRVRGCRQDQGPQEVARKTREDMARPVRGNPERSGP